MIRYLLLRSRKKVKKYWMMKFKKKKQKKKQTMKAMKLIINLSIFKSNFLILSNLEKQNN